jgi:hypothetical protein
MRIVAEGLWDEIRRLAKRAGRKFAAVAYVTSDTHVKFGAGDTLVTDASNKAIKTGQTSAKLLRAAHDRGAYLYSYPGLHAKVYAFDRAVVVGSSNLSSSSEDLLEAAAITEGARAVASVISFVESLTHKAKRIDRKFLDRVDRLPVRPGWKPSKKAGKGPRLPKVPVWLVGVTALADDAHPEESNRAESGKTLAAQAHGLDEEDISWIRYPTGSRFARHAREGHIVIQFWKAHRGAKQVTVYRPAPVLRRQREPSCTRFYVRDLEDADDTATTFGEFTKLWRQLGIRRKLGRAPERLLPERDADRLLTAWEGE